VAAEAEELWPWCYKLAFTRLHDGPSAAQILEEVAAKVSVRLWKDDRVADNLRAYLFRSFVRRLNALIKRDTRLKFRGLSRDLETMLAPVSPDWVREVEVRLIFEAISLALDDTGRRMLNLRRAGFDWHSVASHFKLTSKQARTAFSYRLREAAREIFGSSSLGEAAE
jgi:DNA-directed RNA polymerase specialized sigma24 family protein